MNIQKYLQELKQHGNVNNIPNITETTAHFLRDLILISKTKKAVEIGTAN